MVLADGAKHEFAYAMIVPPFVGQEVIARTPAIADDKGYVKVRDTYQTETYDDVYAVGIAAAVNAPWQTPVAVGIPKTGFPTERMAHVAARNIAAQIRGEQPTAHEGVRRHPGGVCDGRRQQRRHHPRRQDAPTPQARRAHPRPPVPRR